MVEGAPDVVRSGNAVEYAKQLRLEGLGAEGDAVDAVAAQELSELRRHRLRVRLDRDLRRTRERRQQAFQLAGLGEGRGDRAKEDGLELRRVQVKLELELELGQQPVHVGGVLPAAPDNGDEIAVPAAVGAEREVD